MSSQLQELTSLFKEIDSNSRLHSFVYLAQKIGGWKGTAYHFDFALNVPFSPELEDDFMRLQKTGAVKCTENGYVVVESVFSAPGDGNLELLKKLADGETRFLVDLSRLVYLVETGSDPEIPLEERARKFFLMGREKFKELMARARSLKLVLGEG